MTHDFSHEIALVQAIDHDVKRLLARVDELTSRPDAGPLLTAIADRLRTDFEEAASVIGPLATILRREDFQGDGAAAARPRIGLSRDEIEAALEATSGVAAKAARALGVTPATFSKYAALTGATVAPQKARRASGAPAAGATAPPPEPRAWGHRGSGSEWADLRDGDAHLALGAIAPTEEVEDPSAPMGAPAVARVYRLRKAGVRDEHVRAPVEPTSHESDESRLSAFLRRSGEE